MGKKKKDAEEQGVRVRVRKIPLFTKRRLAKGAFVPTAKVNPKLGYDELTRESRNHKLA